jgi:hypothetical protein
MKSLVFVAFLLLPSLAKAASPDAGVKAFLEGFVAAHSKADIDFFYVSQPKKGQFNDYVWIYWMTGNSLLFVDVPTERLKDYEDYDLKSRIRLDSGVVPTADDIEGSNYLVEAKFVETLLRDCLNDGRKIVIKKGPTSR